MGKVDNLLGLCRRAGFLKSGEFSTEQSVKSGSAKLVLISEDASQNTQKKFRNMCAFYEVPIVLYGNKEELGACIGTGERSSISIEDQGFANSIQKKLLS